MSEPPMAFLVTRGKKTSHTAMRGPRTSAPPTPKVGGVKSRVVKRPTRFNDATNPPLNTQVTVGMEVDILYKENGNKVKHRAVVLGKQGSIDLRALTSADVKEGQRLAICGAEVWRVRFFDGAEEWFSPHGAEMKKDDDEWELPKKKKLKVVESETEDGEVGARKGGEDPSV